MRVITFLVIACTFSLLVSCTTIPVEDRAGLRKKINQGADETLTKLIISNPELQESIDTSVGYFAGQISGAKIPVVGAVSGLGMLYDRETGTRTYMNIKRFDVGVGLGAGKYRGVILFQNREVFEQFKAGIWKSKIGIESVVGDKAATTISVVDEGATLHLLSETGAAVTASARLVSLSVNEDLTDTGVSSIGLPNTGFTVVDRQGEDAPRIWEHKLPFLAQKVIDKGYDLPLPYGIGLTYVKVDQDILLDNLEVGINGREEEPFEFVAFGNPSAENDTVQLKFDAWLFPFMNVFALLGKIDGKAPMDIILDGNGMLDHLELDCSGPPLQNPLCELLGDKTFTVPIETKFSGKTYGIGTVLAGGWNNWFVTLPISLNYADMDGKDTEGIAITFTPRFGRVLNLGNKGNLALFAGGNYLKTDLTVSGTVSTPEDNLIIDYTIDQTNKDRWNLVLGYNWDINKRWSWSMEYDGFIGSREAFITSVTRRF
ncbi:hypothetical protein ACFLZQ_07765 [Thermodesulfobacteriota bacterium]